MNAADGAERLRDALLAAPEYFAIPDRERAECKKFLVLCAGTSCEPADREAAYLAAVAEARTLVAKGLLAGVELPEPDPHDPAEGKAIGANEPFPDCEFHPVASIFPMMSDTDLDDLANDIKANGLRDDIITSEGKIVDGRNRYSACRLAGVRPRFREWEATGSIVSWVLSANLHRRHLTDQQRALVAAKAKAAFEAEAQESSLANLLQNNGSPESANLRSRDRNGGKSAKNAAMILGVKTRSVEKAVRILKDGDESLVEAVQQETVSLDAASIVAKLPRAKQRKLVAQEKVKETASKMRKSKSVKSEPTDAPAPEEPPAIEAREPKSVQPAAPRGPASPVATTLSSLIARLPEDHRQPATTLFKDVLGLLRLCVSAEPEHVGLALGGLQAFVTRTRSFLKGRDDGAFLRDSVEGHDVQRFTEEDLPPMWWEP